MKLIKRVYEGETWDRAIVSWSLYRGKSMDFFEIGSAWGRYMWEFRWSKPKAEYWPILPKFELWYLSDKPLYRYKPEQGGYPDRKII